MRSQFDDVFAEANGRAIRAYMRASGGEAELHAKDFELTRGEFSRAMRRLRKDGKAEPVGECVWRLIRWPR